MTMEIRRMIPYPLPVIKKRWRSWQNNTVVNMAREIFADKSDNRYALMPILADALEEAGCTDPEIIRHLRGEQHCRWCASPELKRSNCIWCSDTGWTEFTHGRHGCWEGGCWLINHILEKPQPVVALFSFRPEAQPESFARVINPGDHYGECYCVYVEDCYDPPLYLVEADHEGDAIDEFIESPAGADMAIQDDQKKDYGYRVSKGDMIHGLEIKEGGWINCAGEAVPGPLQEPSITGNGIEYDGESVMVRDVHRVQYHAPDLPLEGVAADDYADRESCDNCKRPYIPGTGNATARFCCLACENQWQSRSEHPYTVCPVCDRCCWISIEVTSDHGKCELHFPLDSNSSYAIPAHHKDEILEDRDGNEISICPGSGQEVPVCR